MRGLSDTFFSTVEFYCRSLIHSFRVLSEYVAHRDDHHWRKWTELKGLTRTDWMGHLEGVPPNMLEAFSKNHVPSFGLPSRKTKSILKTTPLVDKAVSGTGRLPGPLVNRNMMHEEMGTEDFVGSEDENVPDAGNEFDSFASFSDEPEAGLNLNDHEENARGPDARMSDSSSECFPPLEDLKTSKESRAVVAHMGSPPEGTKYSVSFMASC